MNVSRLICLIVLLPVGMSPLFSQGWLRLSSTFLTRNAEQIDLLPDGGYRLGLGGYVARTNPYGEILTETYTVMGLDPGDHYYYNEALNQYVTVNYRGFNPTVASCKITWAGNGQILRVLQIGEGEQDARVCDAPDGFVVANFDSLQAFNMFGINWNGDTVWTKTHTITHDVFYAMCRTSDNGYCILTKDEANNPMLIKTDSTGGILWTNAYEPGTMLDTEIHAYLIENDQGNLVAAYRKGLGYLVELLTADPTGNLLGFKPEIELFNLSGFAQHTDGDYYLLGTTLTNAGRNFLHLLKMDSLGETKMEKKLSLPGDAAHQPLCITALPAGECMMSGFTYGATYYNFLLKLDSLGNLYPNKLIGTARYDQTHNCAANAGEPPLKNWPVTATRQSDGRHFYTTTDSLGHYEIDIDTGTYTVRLQQQGNLWAFCQNDILTSNIQQGDTAIVDFFVQDSLLCSLLDVSIGTPLLRRCFDNTYAIQWCNYGTMAAPDAELDVVLPPELTYVSSTLPLQEQIGDTLRFALGDVDFGDCGAMNLVLLASCEMELNQTLCVTALIRPDTICRVDPDWSGAEVSVTARCLGDTVVQFRIFNTGIATTSSGLEYIITEDLVVLSLGPFTLAPGEELVLEQPANGSFWRINAAQEPFYPFVSNPSAAVEGCGTSGPFSLGLVNQYTLDDGSPFVDIDCHQVVGSFDPNDKQGFPIGYADQHYIEPGTDITYTIRFQNTGTDTAFFVSLRDTLSPWLDPASVRPGASSHPYTWALHEGGILMFHFKDIMLPDSNVNEPASHGFVQFRISHRDDIPLGTQLFNRAGIYFDFNEPVLTNTTLHTVDTGFYTIMLVHTAAPVANLHLQVSPNPFSSSVRIRLEGEIPDACSWRLFDLNGKQVVRLPFINNTLIFNAENLSSGIYMFQVCDASGNIRGTGKLVCRQ